MKTLANQTLLFDEDCPLCRVYTSGFIKAGMLDENGKKPYCQLSAEEQNFIDVKRASNEIALVDNENKTVIYGIDSLLKVIGFSFPWMEKIGNLKPIKYFLKKLYSFISYNRKVIIPSKIKQEIKLQCVPDFNYKYRILYILFAIATSSLLINKFNDNFVFSKTLLLTTVLLLIQNILILKFTKEIVLNYLGNFTTSILFGSLLLLPIIILKSFVNLPEITFQIYFYFIISITIIEIVRRIQIMKSNLK
ncbi:hypothetical protein GCM10022389_23680 [Flavobacterium cheonanense]|uniref:DUF393 domain-containing protein n=1 Tax=Flavobacterium cheonanense TaxID=706183 RepID=A0ABP7VY75_9FLAO